MAKRISSSSVNWNLIFQLISDVDKSNFTLFRNKSEKFLRAVLSQPSELPKIDWNYYKTQIATPGMVDSFQKSYESMKIPYPSDDGYLAKVDQKEATSLKEAAKSDEESIKKMQELSEELKRLEKALPYSEMSLEEFAIACPEYRIDPDKPKLFPQFIDTEYEDGYKPPLH